MQFLTIIRLFIYDIKYLTLSRIINFLRLGLSYLFSIVIWHKNTKLSPFFLSIEVSNFCNLRCPECPVGINQHSAAEHANFNVTLYKKLIDELKPTLQHVILYFQGEPFLNNRLAEFVHYAHKSNIYTSTSTNGQTLNKKNAKEIVLSGLDKLIVSVDGSTQEVYESYRIGGNLQKTLDGISEVVFWKTELKSRTPLIEIQFIVMKSNEHQIMEIRQLAKNVHVNKLTFKTAQLYDFENGHKLLPTNDRYSRYLKDKNGKFRIKGKQPNRCWRLWSGAVINAYGEVLPCCFDKLSEFSFGNINSNSFLSCWHNKKASDFRASILKNRKQFKMCLNCTSN